MCACVQLTAKEMELIHGMLADRNHKPMDTVRAVNTARRKAGVEELGKTSIYNCTGTSMVRHIAEGVLRHAAQEVLQQE